MDMVLKEAVVPSLARTGQELISIDEDLADQAWDLNVIDDKLATNT